MFKRVDNTNEDTPITGYSYLNQDEKEEVVVLSSAKVVKVVVSDGDGGTDTAAIYTRDIPKLILALQAAYDHKQG